MARPRAFDEEEVLAKARDQFWLGGYTATSISDLEAATGLQRTSLYAAFGDKRALFERVLNRYSGENINYLRDVAASAKTWRTGLDRIFGDAIARLSVTKPCRGCLVANATTELAAVDATTQAFVAANRERFVAALLPLAEGHETPAMTARAACEYVFTLYSGLTLFAKTGATREQLEAVTTAGLRVFA